MKNGEMRRGPLSLSSDGGLVDAADAADAGADQDAGRASGPRRLGLPAGVGERLVGGRHGEDDEVVDLALLLRLHPVVGIERAVDAVAARDVAGDLAGRSDDLEVVDATRAALAGEEARPGRLDAAAERRHHAHAGDDARRTHRAMPEPARRSASHDARGESTALA